MKKVLLILLLVGILTPIRGQNIPLRGKLAPQYHFLYNGTPLVDDSPVGRGSVMLDGRLYESVSLHLNAVSQDLVIYPQGNEPFRPPRAEVDWFTKDGVLYVNAPGMGYALPEGFYRVVYDGSVAVLERISKVLVENTGHHNSVRDLGYEDPSYRPDVYKYFAWSRQWFVLQDTVAIPLRRPKDLVRLNLEEGEKAWKEVGRTSRNDNERILALMKRLDAGAAPSVVLPWVARNRTDSEISTATVGRTDRARPDTLILPLRSRDVDVWADVDSTLMLQGASVSADRMDPHHTALQGVVRLPAKALGRIPTAFGEGDILKAVQSLPGVKSVGEASGGLNVRGGAADQNLILFNGSTIYNQGHLFGVLSGFNPDLVQDVTLYKGSVPVRYGGRMSAVLDIRGRDGNDERIRGSIGLGLLTSRLRLDGPLGQRTTFIAGGRISYSDYLLRNLPERSAYRGGSAGFYDFNLGLKHQIDIENVFRLSIYGSSDRFSFSRDTTFRYANRNISLQWDHGSVQDGMLSVSAGYDSYRNHLQDTGQAYAAYNLRTDVRQGWFRTDYSRVREPHNFRVGLDVTGYALMGGHRTPEGEASLVMDERLGKEYGIAAALYAGAEFRPAGPWSAEGGLRLASYMGGGAIFLYPEVRLSGKYSPRKNLSFKVGAGTMSQPIHVVSNTTAISPMDTWKLSDRDVRPTTGGQGSLGAYWTDLSWGLDLSVESYYKRLRNYLDYRSGATLVMNPSLSDDLLPVQGKAWGVEVMARRPKGRLNGWIAYTWSRTFLRDASGSGVTAIDGGKWYPASYDKPHEFKMTANYEFTHRYSFSLGAEYSTGRPVTVPLGYYSSGGGYRLAYSDRNGYRIPDYFRLDAAFHMEPGHYLKALAHTSVTIGCYNLTGRRNAYSVYYTTEGGSRVRSYMVSVFPSPIPYINLNILF